MVVEWSAGEAAKWKKTWQPGQGGQFVLGSPPDSMDVVGERRVILPDGEHIPPPPCGTLWLHWAAAVRLYDQPCQLPVDHSKLTNALMCNINSTMCNDLYNVISLLFSSPLLSSPLLSSPLLSSPLLSSPLLSSSLLFSSLLFSSIITMVIYLNWNSRFLISYV